MVVLGEAADGLEALQLAHTHQPDVAILDIAMPHLNGLETTRRLREAVPQTKIIVLTMHTEEPYVLEALQAGAVGYVLKMQAAVDIVQAIHTVVQCSGRQGLNLAGESPAISIARFGYVAMPQFV
jgi:DNA-binding NarL/FixJ family response regulator